MYKTGNILFCRVVDFRAMQYGTEISANPALKSGPTNMENLALEQAIGRPVAVIHCEDDVLVRMVTADFLTDAGYRVMEASDAEEALRLLEVRPDIRVLVTDVNMPGGLDGFALARIVDMRWPGVGVIVTSGRMAPRTGDLPRRAVFLSKPCPPSDLLDAVAAFTTPQAQEAVLPGVPVTPSITAVEVGVGATATIPVGSDKT